MITVLDVVRNNNDTLMKKIRSVFKPYDIYTKVKKQNKCSVLYIRYSQNRGKVRYKKIYPYTIGSPKTILCSRELDLSGSPFSRFEDKEFNILMMQNFVCELLKSASPDPKRIKLAYLDRQGEYPMFAQKLLDYTASLTVVTDMPRFYENESDRIYESCGVPLIVSDSIEKLKGQDVIISPRAIDITLPVTTDTLLFTAEKPLVSLKGIVISEYLAEIPYRYKRLLPKGTDEMYFMSALYSLCSAGELASIVPAKCADGTVQYSKERLISKLRKFTQEQTKTA